MEVQQATELMPPRFYGIATRGRCLVSAPFRLRRAQKSLRLGWEGMAGRGMGRGEALCAGRALV